jgi:hypothetical protein
LSAAALSEALKSNATLTSLGLVARALLCAGGPVSPRLSLTPSSRCSLRFNQIGPVGATALSQALKSNATLTSLE